LIWSRAFEAGGFDLDGRLLRRSGRAFLARRGQRREVRFAEPCRSRMQIENARAQRQKERAGNDLPAVDEGRRPARGDRGFQPIDRLAAIL
jgi:hypothetical protein